MLEGAIGEGGWAEIPGSFIRVFAVLGADGWEFSVFDTEKMTCLKRSFASSEPDAHERAEAWVLDAGLTKKERLDWIAF